MLHLPALRWGKPYDSLEKVQVVHFDTGEPIAQISQVGGGVVQKDLRQSPKARAALRQLPIDELVRRCQRAGELFETAELPMGDGRQTVEQFVRQQSASTGLPEHMCRSNMGKNAFVLKNIDRILDALTRGLDLSILARGFGEEGRGVPISYQAQSSRSANRFGAQARFARTMDSLPDGGSFH
jgi:hypothetical protein